MQTQAPEPDNLSKHRKKRDKLNKILNFLLFLYLIVNIWFISYTVDYLKNPGLINSSTYEAIKFSVDIGFLAVFFLAGVIYKLINLTSVKYAGTQQRNHVLQDQLSTNQQDYSALNLSALFDFNSLKTKSFILLAVLLAINLVLTANSLKIAKFFIENF